MKIVRSLSLVLCVIFLSCTTSQKPIPPEAWSSRMQRLAVYFSNLYPLVADKREFNNPANFKEIESLTQEMAKISHEIKNDESIAALDSDPLIKYVGSTFDRQVRLSEDALAEGNRDFARVLLKNASHQCISCHTRGQWGPEFQGILEGSRFNKIVPLERGELLVALRRYDEATKIYNDILSHTVLAKERPNDFDQALRRLVSLQIKVKNEPEQALQAIQKALSNPNIPYYVSQEAQGWRETILFWKRENNSGGKFKNKLEAGKHFFETAQKNDESPLKKGNYVLYLRAGAVLHEYLRTQPQPKEEAEILFLLGQIYEKTQDHSQPSFNELYYKACIETVPHTSQAMKCFEMLEESASKAFSHFGEGRIPLRLLDYLDSLKKTAMPFEM